MADSISHIIFDMDGTLLDTEQIYTQVRLNLIETGYLIYLNMFFFLISMIFLFLFLLLLQVTQEFLDPFGKTFEWELKSMMMGKRSEEAAEILIRELDLSISVEEYLEVWKFVF